MHPSLEIIDFVAKKDGKVQYWQTDDRPMEVVTRDPALATLFVLTRLINPRRDRAAPADAVVVYSARYEPPLFLRQAIHAAGARLTVGSDLMPREPFPPSEPASGGSWLDRARRLLGGGAEKTAGSPLDDIVQRAFVDLARATIAEHGVQLDEAGLLAVEDALAARNPDRKRDEDEYWSAVFRLGSVAGEVIRGAFGGEWRVARESDVGPLPFALTTRYREGIVRANVLNKAMKRFQDGREESLLGMVFGLRKHQ